MGSGGFALWDPAGKCVAGMGFYFGKDARTNNVAEAQTLVRALRVVRAGNWIEHRATLVVRGDSGLCISFMNKNAKPGKRELVVAVREANDTTRGWGRKVLY